MDTDALDVDLALERLTAALPLQLRSAAAYTMAAASITGSSPSGWAGCCDPEPIVDRLIELETEAIDALQATIPATGHTGDAEALEHMILRKQEQVDTLLRARRGAWNRPSDVGRQAEPKVLRE